ncbi:hypothetical protein HHL26_06820 [Sphingobium sp. TB-6]|uniref:hypothetical protein n=1 Tax=Sphingobium sp. TB-6 TaxID=2728850 RepID=UPI00146E61FA|nr:hypothetical protein [Sphingobium sp. TB-6]NML88779.1 hypothetical protein [Sphingobium sp. TB-6]
MSTSDPIMFAAKVIGMSDAELLAAIRNVALSPAQADYRQALLDEAVHRHLVSDTADPMPALQAAPSVKPPLRKQ